MLTMRFVCRYLLVVFAASTVVFPIFFLLHFVYKYHGEKYQQIVYLEQNKVATPTDSQCRFHSCFDILKCEPQIGGQMKIYVNPKSRFVHLSEDVFDEWSYEFNEILHTIKQSNYVTHNLSEACIYIPSIDLLSEKGLNVDGAAIALSSLDSWSNGRNNIVFNIYPTLPLPSINQLHIQTGNAMIVASNFITSNYRQGFDISIPLFNTMTVIDPNKHHLAYNAARRWKLMISQISISSDNRKSLRKLEDDDPAVFMLRKCLGETDSLISHQKLCKDGLPFKYPAILKDGLFCLIVRGPYFATTLLLDSMMMGCIPVIVMDEYVMPFEGVIDWSRASVRIRDYQLPTLLSILNQYDDEEILLRQQQAFFLWKKYFSSINRIVNTVLSVLNERIYMNQRKSYEEWNGEIVAKKTVIKSSLPSSSSLRPAREEGFTAVILTYNRVSMCITLMKRLQKVDSLRKIIIVWNNPYADPTKEKWPNGLKKPWKLIRTKSNRLTNRFYPFKEIETEAVMAIDDDILMLTTDEIEFAYQAWKEFPDRLVGFPARIHVTKPHELINGKRFQYKYESEWSNSVSMVLTGAAFYHQIYNHKFTYGLPLKTINYIDEKMNCEDIAMNFLISNLTGKAPIKVTPRKRFKCAQCGRNDSLWSEDSHFIKRSQCLIAFTQHFGKMPLEVVEFRADPVLFQESVPLDMMAYPDVGIV